ncbi:MAG TPA: hypothetical protein VKB72_12640 [Steroidobacteraceae bacterium]|nr:hypothetical protein [Steroidobacteraceae bacterium]
MNEIELLRDQLTTERQHARAVANVCAVVLQRPESSTALLAEFRQSCVDYLVCVLAWFEERDQRLGDLTRARFAPEDAARRALEDALARPGRSRETLERLAAAVAGTATTVGTPPSSWSEFAQYFNGVWSTRRDAVDALLAPNPRVSDWRAVSGIDADSILEERQLYARVGERLPPGVSLSGSDPGGEPTS